jgi:ribosome-binding protein aMBF1 (putative translation factor)
MEKTQGTHGAPIRINLIDLVKAGSRVHAALLESESRQLRRGFGEVLRRRRETLGISRETVAKKSGLRKSKVAYVEDGEQMASLDTVYRIALALGKSAAELVAEAESLAEYI